MSPTPSNTCPFNYASMALEAIAQRDALQGILKKRRASPPPSPALEYVWQRENIMLYRMYLEQRKLAMELSQRAARRGQELPQQAGPYLVRPADNPQEAGCAA